MFCTFIFIWNLILFQKKDVRVFQFFKNKLTFYLQINAGVAIKISLHKIKKIPVFSNTSLSVDVYVRVSPYRKSISIQVLWFAGKISMITYW